MQHKKKKKRKRKKGKRWPIGTSMVPSKASNSHVMNEKL
jgi:hypothetical protein